MDWFNVSAPWMGPRALRFKLWNLWRRVGIGWGAGVLQVRERHLLYIGATPAGFALDVGFLHLGANPSVS